MNPTNQATEDAAPGAATTSPEPRQLSVVRVERGGPWDWSAELREQRQWTEHANFMNGLVDQGLILLGGPLAGDKETLHVVTTIDEDEIRARFGEDPWAKNGMLRIVSIERWTILLDADE